MRSEGGAVVLGLEGGHGPGPRLHHHRVGQVLLEVPLDLVAVGVLMDEVEDGQVVAGVALDPLVVLQVEQGQVALVVLPGLLEEVLAALLVELGAALGGRSGPVGQGLAEVVQEGLGPVGAVSVGTAADLELENPHVDADLDLLRPVPGGDPAGDELVRIEGPGIEQITDIVFHGPSLGL